VVAAYKDSSRARMRVSIWACARVGGRSCGFSRGGAFFPCFEVSPSSEIGGQVLSGFHGSLERPLNEFVNFVAFTGSMLGLGILNRGYCMLAPEND